MKRRIQVFFFLLLSTLIFFGGTSSFASSENEMKNSIDVQKSISQERIRSETSSEFDENANNNLINNRKCGYDREYPSLRTITNPIVDSGKAVSFGIWKIYNDGYNLLIVDTNKGRAVGLWFSSNGWIDVKVEEGTYTLWSDGSSSAMEFTCGNISVASSSTSTGNLSDGTYGYGNWTIVISGGTLTITNSSATLSSTATIDKYSNAIKKIGYYTSTTFPATYSSSFVDSGKAVSIGNWKVYNDNNRYLLILDTKKGRVLSLYYSSNGWVTVKVEDGTYTLWSIGDSSESSYLGGDLTSATSSTPYGSLVDGIYNYGTWVLTVSGTSITIENPTGAAPNQRTVIAKYSNGIQHVGSSYTTNFPATDAENKLPIVTITSPYSGQYFTTASVTVQGTASDSDGTVSEVQVRVNSTGIWTTASGTTYWVKTVTLSSLGTNTIYIKAKDNTGAWSQEVSVNVVYPPPTTTVTTTTTTTTKNTTTTTTKPPTTTVITTTTTTTTLPPTSKVTLTIDDIKAPPGSKDIPVSIALSNSQTPVSSIQFRLKYNASIGIHANTRYNLTTRTSGYTGSISVTENGASSEALILLFSTSGGIIPSGTGAILTVLFDVDFSAVSGSTSNLSFTECLVSDSSANSIPSLFTDTGIFTVGSNCEPAGDINHDGKINIFDLQLLINCVLSKGSCECSDLNADTKYNIFDIQTIINKILHPTTVTRSMKSSDPANILTLPNIDLKLNKSGTFGLDMSNQDAVSAIQVELLYDSTVGFEISGAKPTSRSTGFLASVNTDKTDPEKTKTTVLFYNMSGGTISAGSGNILEFTYTTVGCSSVTCPISTAIAFNDALLSDSDANSLSVKTLSGTASFGCDANRDGKYELQDAIYILQTVTGLR